MTNPSKDPKFNAALQKMLKAPPKQNKDIKGAPKLEPKPVKKPKPWPWEKN